MTSIKRNLALILAAIMLVSLLAGCARDDDDEPVINDSGDAFINFIDTSGEAYKSSVIPFPELPEGLTFVNNVLLTDNVVYFTAWGDGGEQSSVSVNRFFSMDVDGTNMTELQNYIPASVPPGTISSLLHYISVLNTDSEGNFWVAEFRDAHGADFPDGFGDSILRKLDKTGAEISKFDLSDLPVNSESVLAHALNVDDAGNIYIASEEFIFVLDSSGNLLFSLGNPDWLANFVRFSDGTVMFAIYQDANVFLRSFNLELKEWGDIIALPSGVFGVNNVYSGTGEFLYLYNDHSHLVGVVTDTGAHEKLLNWVDSALTSVDITGVMFLPDGRISATKQSLYGASTTQPVAELLLLSQTSFEDDDEDDDEPIEKIEFTFATFDYDSPIRYAVEHFNRNNRTHRINVVDYSRFSDGLLRLSTEIITGNSPDIIDLRALPLHNYAKKGLLVDLYPFLDADPELSRSSVLENLLKASEIDGSLYRIVPSFGVVTTVGDPAVVGEYPGWNINEFVDVLRANPQADTPLGSFGTKANLLWITIYNNIDEYIDWSSGTVSFDNDDFIGLLEMINTFPARIDRDIVPFEAVPAGQQIIEIDFFGPNVTRWHNMIFNSNFIYKGLPVAGRDGNIFLPSTNIAITTNCADPGAAWEFVRIFLTEDYQRNAVYQWRFPINRVVFDESLEFFRAPPETLYDGMSGSGFDVRFSNDPLSHEEVDSFRDFMESITRIRNVDDTVWDIINETATDFFNGMMTAREAARIIQNRASRYVAELS